MSTEGQKTNRETIERWYSALQAGDLDTFRDLHHEDVIYDISGHSVISGRQCGRDKMLNVVVPAVMAALNLEEFTFCTQYKIVAAEGNCVVGVMEADGKAARGGRYDQRYVHIFELDNGRIQRVMEFFDTELAAQVLFTEADRVEPDAPFTL